MPKSTDSQITLEELLRLKRHEAPEPAFWEQFDRDLERRRLRALVVPDEGRGSSFWAGWRRTLALASGTFAAAGAVGFAFLQRAPQFSGAFVESPASAEVASVPSEATIPAAVAGQPVHEASLAPAPAIHDLRLADAIDSRFVQDVINARVEQSHFRSVLSNPSFVGMRADDAQFVSDSWTTTGRSRATFLVDRPSGQF